MDFVLTFYSGCLLKCGMNPAHRSEALHKSRGTALYAHTQNMSIAYKRPNV